MHEAAQTFNASPEGLTKSDFIIGWIFWRSDVGASIYLSSPPSPTHTHTSTHTHVFLWTNGFSNQPTISTSSFTISWLFDISPSQSCFFQQIHMNVPNKALSIIFRSAYWRFCAVAHTVGIKYFHHFSRSDHDNVIYSSIPEELSNFVDQSGQRWLRICLRRNVSKIIPTLWTERLR